MQDGVRRAVRVVLDIVRLRVGELELRVEGGDLQFSHQAHALEQTIRQVFEVVEVQEVVQRVGDDQQGRVDLFGIGLGQQRKFILQVGQDAFGVGGVADGKADLVLDLNRLGERAKIQADHGLSQPVAGFSHHVGISVGSRNHAGMAAMVCATAAVSFLP
ncbi:hypothetical protein D3C72_1033800 [compost metagenome]